MRPRTIGAAALAAAWCAPAPAAVMPWFATPFGIDLRLPSPHGIALTFDDGPHPQGTPAVLEILAHARVRATFFLVGEQVERRPGLAAEIAAAGHEIAVHGYRHTLLLRRTPWELSDDLARAADVIGAATGIQASRYRPPYGVFSTAGLTIARRRGWRPLLWSRWARDWTRNATPMGIARRATRNLTAGDVVLLHDADFYSAQSSWARTAAALPSIVEAALATGEPLVSASQTSGQPTRLR
ncbi:MAG: polysaccharide deacetylase family protein [Gaiellaceae bacterium]